MAAHTRVRGRIQAQRYYSRALGQRGTCPVLEGGEIQHQTAAHSAFGQPLMRSGGLVGR